MIEISRNAALAVVAAWLLVFSLRGYRIGFLRGAYHLAEVIVALACIRVAAKRFPLLSGGAGACGGFLVVLFILRWAGRLLDIVNHIPVLRGVNRALGVLLGFFEGIALLGIFYMWLGSGISFK